MTFEVRIILMGNLSHAYQTRKKTSIVIKHTEVKLNTQQYFGWI